MPVIPLLPATELALAAYSVTASVRGPGLPGQLGGAAATKELVCQPAEQATMDYTSGKVG